MQLIPAIDLRGGHCVRLLKGDFAAETRYERTPLDLLQHYRALGARWLHVVDLDGARDGQLANRQAIVQLAAQTGIHVQLGGGVRSAAILEELLALGVARVAVGSAAVEQREQVSGWLSHYGAERICLALDVQLDEQQRPLLRTRGWRQATALSLWDAVESYMACGLRHVLCTDIERDGVLAGPNLALYTQAVARFPQVHWQASGGVSSIADLAALANSGVASAISGKALLENLLPEGELQPYLPGA